MTFTCTKNAEKNSHHDRNVPLSVRNELSNFSLIEAANTIMTSNNKSNLYIAQFDTNGILTALYIVKKYIVIQNDKDIGRTLSVQILETENARNFVTLWLVS